MDKTVAVLAGPGISSQPNPRRLKAWKQWIFRSADHSLLSTLCIAESADRQKNSPRAPSCALGKLQAGQSVRPEITRVASATAAARPRMP